MGNFLPGTKIDATKIKIISAYILTKNSKETYIVIVTESGSEVYPYALELENALKTIVGNLNTHEVDIHEVIKFFYENSSVVNLLNTLAGKKEKFTP
ncbi:hypothetical protein M4R22_02825 [Acidovorax sp. GBBC 3334]|uniref:hypothetical protein n=1 Tax=Acidovorax sp. GBBC 3334 TaxID=2940496 RepID=UPI002302DF3F|nr:hypothetical protein [Acidovorax sp. GBBC 3334]MDA8453690.1 hypothetical protein [Acidovorax sp. GBBC 3334]